MTSGKPYNFSAGPAILPQVVFERASDAVRELRENAHARDADGVGLSILEISHRSKPFADVHERAVSLCHEVLGIPRTHEVLLLQGGASLQFCMVPMNLGEDGKTACYVDTGAWSQKAIKESKVRGETRVIASSAQTNYDRIPELPGPESYADASYVHITGNNTIFGTEYPEIPDLGDALLVNDMSSHIGSRPMKLERLAVGYAGAQKNLGPSGVTLVFIRKDLLERDVPATVPHFLRYATHAKAGSLYNTPNTFGALVLQLVLEWVRDEGGAAALAERNRRKAAMLYETLDASSLYKAHAQPGSRSNMNVTWTLNGANDDEIAARTGKIIADAGAAGLSGIKGHRSVGGCRASIYNAFPEQGVQVLCEFLREFERTA